jgi:hypothetical protein
MPGTRYDADTKAKAIRLVGEHAEGCRNRSRPSPARYLDISTALAVQPSWTLA